jgi:nitrous oxide reductase accessory protein NosL
MRALIKSAILPALCLLMLLSAQLRAEEHRDERESCRVCGMWVDEYQKSAAELVYKNGKKEYSCGVACMLRIIEDEGGMSAFESVKVHDWVSGRLVDAEDASFVLGSDVIPDMVPNYIAFANRDEAEDFAAKHGGVVIDFNIAYQDISPVGTTAPFRVRTAVTPGKGNFSVGMVYGYTEKDRVKIGSSRSKAPGGFIGANQAQPRAPSSLEGHQQALIMNYSPTDDLALFMNVPWLERRTHTLERQQPGGPVFDKAADENGIGDITLESRYNLWRSTRWDKFVSVLLGTTLPTGQFSATRQPVNSRMAPVDPSSGARQTTPLIGTGPALQLGKDTATFTGGLLYSERWKDWWLHTSALYTANPKNDDNYAFGDVATAGLALHYTPNYDLMVGMEMDASYTEKSIDNGVKLGNSGGTTVNLAFVTDYRFLNAFGGNFKLRSSVGLPVYEDLNSRDLVNARGMPFQQVQLGEGFFANVAIQWTTRMLPDEF